MTLLNEGSSKVKFSTTLNKTNTDYAYGRKLQEKTALTRTGTDFIDDSEQLDFQHQPLSNVWLAHIKRFSPPSATYDVMVPISQSKDRTIVATAQSGKKTLRTRFANRQAVTIADQRKSYSTTHLSGAYLVDQQRSAQTAFAFRGVG